MFKTQNFYTFSPTGNISIDLRTKSEYFLHTALTGLHYSNSVTRNSSYQFKGSSLYFVKMRFKQNNIRKKNKLNIFY